MVGAVTDTLDLAYGLHVTEATHIPVGTATVNYLVTDRSGDQWFAKVYRDRTVLQREREAVELAEFARAGQVPIPGVRRTREGKLVEDLGRVPMSVWQYIADAETAEGGLTGDRWQAVGAVLGRLHRRLADHPAAASTARPGAGIRDMQRTRARFDRLIAEYHRRSTHDPFEVWALDALEERRALLDRVTTILARLPELTEQIVHGDLASPNLLLRGDNVAAVIDFQPPTPRYVSWEIARIGCDPRTILLGDQWVTGLPELLAAYRTEYPAARLNDLISTVAVGCAYTLASTYPLAEPLDNPSAVEASLQAYGRARHEAALVLLDKVDETQDVLRDHLR
ncbi:aminoglycoside phosphotransferase [Jiangella asiatica]|uniref:Aminoglycoside phosphotransferase n=1 Tax=Jiangella asiatica TaxID=2530372 RepID=A0A4R5DM95_9ACTN|nr:aminoglycoside phosphotransferase [Jiangella asiatica]